MRPTAITGTWSDLERRAVYLYETAYPDSDAWEMAEAILVLLNIEMERARHNDSDQTNDFLNEAIPDATKPHDDSDDVCPDCLGNTTPDGLCDTCERA